MILKTKNIETQLRQVVRGSTLILFILFISSLLKYPIVSIFFWGNHQFTISSLPGRWSREQSNLAITP